MEIFRYIGQNTIILSKFGGSGIKGKNDRIQFILPSEKNDWNQLQIFNFTRCKNLTGERGDSKISSISASEFAYKEIDGDIDNLRVFEKIKLYKNPIIPSGCQ